MFITEMIAIKLFSMNMNLKMLTMMVDTYGINWKWNNWYHFHFCFNYHFVYFQLKTNSVELLKYQLSPWLVICTSFNGLSHHIVNMAINYIEIMCASKLRVFNIVFCKIQFSFKIFIGINTASTGKSKKQNMTWIEQNITTKLWF